MKFSFQLAWTFTQGSVACALVLSACGDGEKIAQIEAAAGAAQSASLATYHGEMRALLEANCVECHKQGGIGPMRLDAWEHVKPVAGAVVAAVSAGRMPPWPADDTCRQIVDARGLSQAVKDRFTAWQEGGFQEGQQSAYVAPAPRPRLELGEPTKVMAGDAPFTPAENTDTYRCFYLGVLESDTYVKAVDLIPGVNSEVHHIQLHRVDAPQIPALVTLQNADAQGGYACSSSGVGNAITSQNMFSYRPGSLAVLFNPGDAAYFKGGSGLVLQIHYNTQFLPAGEVPTPDLSKLALWTLPAGAPPERVIYRTGVLSPLSGSADGNARAFLSSSIAPNAKVIGESTVPMENLSRVGGRGLSVGAATGAYIAGEIVGVTPHAHSWATRMTATLRPAGAAEQCLLEVPKWDYGWQLDYMFKEGLPYAPSDELHVACHYDNTAENQPIVNGMRRAPQTITFGENTLNEMCLHYLWLRFKYADFVAQKL